MKPNKSSLLYDNRSGLLSFVLQRPWGEDTEVTKARRQMGKCLGANFTKSLLNFRL